MDPVNVPAKFEVRSLERLKFWGGVANLQSRERGRSGSEMAPSERALVRPSIVTFPLSLRVSEISLMLLGSSTPLFPTPRLVSPNFPIFPWE